MRKIFIAGLCLFVSISAFAEDTRELKPFSMPSPRSRALGGDHVAYAGGVDALFVNPAELRRKKEFSALALSASLTNPLWINKVAYQAMNGELDGDDGELDYAKIADLIPKPMRLPVGFDMQGPLALGFVGGGFGIGLFDRASADARIKGLNIELDISADAALSLGYAYRFNLGSHFAIDAGVGAKVFGRAAKTVEQGFTDLLGALSEDFDLDALGLTELPLIAGATADLGATVHLSFLPTVLNDDFAVALVWTDALSYAKEVADLGSSLGLAKEGEEWKPYEGYYTIPSAIKLGVSYSFSLGKLLKIAVMADHSDAINLIKYASSKSQEDSGGDGAWATMRNPILDTSLGAEVTLFNILSVRAGMRDLLPAAGIGLNLFIFQLDAAIYGKELGTYPGDFTTMAVDVGLSFKF